MLMRKMKPAGAVMLVAAAAVVLSGCASSGTSEADEFAATACGIEFSDETGEAVFVDGRTVDPWELTYQEVQGGRERAEAAASAAAEDPIYADLKSATSVVYAKKKKAFDTWRSIGPNIVASPTNIATFWQMFDQADVDIHNEAVTQMQVECSALADRLNA